MNYKTIKLHFKLFYRNCLFSFSSRTKQLISDMGLDIININNEQIHNNYFRMKYFPNQQYIKLDQSNDLATKMFISHSKKKIFFQNNNFLKTLLSFFSYTRSIVRVVWRCFGKTKMRPLTFLQVI